MIQLEVCVDSVTGARAAESGGAQRVELVADFAQGGTTPSFGMLERALETLSIPLVVLVRPRAGDFCYEREEFEVLKKDVLCARELGAFGVALGVLSSDGTVDRGRTAELVDLARPMAVTFHRAIDATLDPLAALDVLLELGVDRVLSSGGGRSATEGAAILARMVARAGSALSVMPAGAVRPGNARGLISATGARELHFSAFAETEGAMRRGTPALQLSAAPLSRPSALRVTEASQVEAMRAALAD